MRVALRCLLLAASSVVAACTGAAAPRASLAPTTGALRAPAPAPAATVDSAPSVARLEVAPVVTPSPAPPAPVGPPVERFGESEAQHWDSEALESFSDPTELCQEKMNQVLEQHRNGELADPPGSATCTKVPLGVTFAPGGRFRELTAVRVFDGVSSYTAVLARVDERWIALPVAIDWDSPNDPGCFGSTRETGLELARVEQGNLVVAVLVESSETTSEDVGPQWQDKLVRRFLVVRPFADGVFARTYSGDWGEKRQASGARPWKQIGWRGYRFPRFDAAGRLR